MVDIISFWVSWKSKSAIDQMLSELLSLNMATVNMHKTFIPQDSNLKELVGPRFIVQRGCTYQEVEYRTAILPGCPSHADPHFTYPVALSCHCSSCKTHSDECTIKSRSAGMRCSKPVHHLYPEESNYAQAYWDQYE